MWLSKVIKMGEETDTTKESLSKSQTFYGSLPDPTIIKAEKIDVKPTKVKYTSVQWLTLITLAFGNFCAGACVSLQAPFFPAEAERKGATPTEYGLIFGMFQLTIFLTAPLMGKLVSFVSPKFLLNSGILTVGVTCILFGTLDMIQHSRTFVAMAFVIRTIEGIGAAALRTSCYTIIASQFADRIGTTFAVLETFLGVGLITGPTLGGALYDLGGYGLPFYVIGGIVMVDTIIIFFILPDVEKKLLPKRESLLKFWMHLPTIVFSLSVLSAFNLIGFYQATLEPHIRRFQLSGFFLGMLFALSGTVYAITAPIWGWLCDTLCNSRILSLAGCFLCMISLTFIGPLPFINMELTIYHVIIGIAVFGLSIGAKMVCAFTGTLEDTANRGMPPGLATYGLVSSMIASSQSLGAFIGPSLGGVLLDKLGFRNSTFIFLIVEIILAILFIVFLCTYKGGKSVDFPQQEKKDIAPVCTSVTLARKYDFENGIKEVQ